MQRNEQQSRAHLSSSLSQLCSCVSGCPLSSTACRYDATTMDGGDNVCTQFKCRSDREEEEEDLPNQLLQPSNSRGAPSSIHLFKRNQMVEEDEFGIAIIDRPSRRRRRRRRVSFAAASMRFTLLSSSSSCCSCCSCSVPP